MQVAQLIPEHNASLETMQPAYPMRVEQKDRRPYRILRQQWMQHYQNAVGGPGALAAALDSTDTHITAMVKGRRNVGDDLADKLELTFNLSPGTIDARDPSGLSASQKVGEAPAQPSAPTLAQALEVVMDAMAQSTAKAELKQLLPMLVETNASAYRTRLGELLGQSLQKQPSIADKLLAIPSEVESPRLSQRATEK